MGAGDEDVDVLELTDVVDLKLRTEDLSELEGAGGGALLTYAFGVVGEIAGGGEGVGEWR